MSDQSDSESDNEVKSAGFQLVNNYTIILLDCTSSMKDEVKQCLSDLCKIYSALQTSAHTYTFKSGVITLGSLGSLEGEGADHDQNENVTLVQPKVYNITKLQAALENFTPAQCVTQHLPFKQAIDLATDMIMLQCRAKAHDYKTIILITNNPTPQLLDPEDATQAARLLSRNDIHFLLYPCGGAFVKSKFYRTFFTQLPEGSCELIIPNETFLITFAEYLKPYPRKQSTRLYFTENNYFETNATKMFQIKYHSRAKAVQKSDGEIVRAKFTQGYDQYGHTATKLIELNDEPGTTSDLFYQPKWDKYVRIGETEVVFKKDELTAIDKKCGEPKARSLYLMYVGDVCDNHIVSDDVRSRIVTSKSSSESGSGSDNNSNKKDQTMFISFWLYCVEHDKGLYCIYLSKTRSYVVLKPILYKDEPVFIQYAIGYANNFKRTKMTKNEEETKIKIPKNKGIVVAEQSQHESDAKTKQLRSIMGDILMKLKREDTSFIDVPDPKLVFEKELLKAKLNKTEYEQKEYDGLSKEAFQVDEKIGDLAKQFNSVLKQK